MKRLNNLYSKIVSHDNLLKAIDEVNRTHKYSPRHRLNRSVLYYSLHKDDVIEELQRILEEGYEPEMPRITRRWDKTAGKWREIAEPKIFPDQYIHHAYIQVMQPLFMRGMDHWCVGCIKYRGAEYGRKALSKWIQNDTKNTKYCLEMDIRHFYNNINPRVVVARVKQLCKDGAVIDLTERILTHGVLIGGYASQWFANVLLQPLDAYIRAHKCCKHYIRNVDNFTILGSNKKELHKLREDVEIWLNNIGLELKPNWQVYPIDSRDVQALGYRYSRKGVRLRKKSLIKIKQSVNRILRMCDNHNKIPHKIAFGAISRIGQLAHTRRCEFFKYYIPFKFQLKMKRIIREYMANISDQTYNTYLMLIKPYGGGSFI